MNSMWAFQQAVENKSPGMILTFARSLATLQILYKMQKKKKKKTQVIQPFFPWNCNITFKLVDLVRSASWIQLSKSLFSYAGLWSDLIWHRAERKYLSYEDISRAAGDHLKFNRNNCFLKEMLQILLFHCLWCKHIKNYNISACRNRLV